MLWILISKLNLTCFSSKFETKPTPRWTILNWYACFDSSSGHWIITQNFEKSDSTLDWKPKRHTAPCKSLSPNFTNHSEHRIFERWTCNIFHERRWRYCLSKWVFCSGGQRWDWWNRHGKVATIRIIKHDFNNMHRVCVTMILMFNFSAFIGGNETQVPNDEMNHHEDQDEKPLNDMTG